MNKIKLFLSDTEIGLSAIDDICGKYLTWLKISKEEGGRKTRSANRKADILYEEIMAFDLPPLDLNSSPITREEYSDSDSTSGRFLRSRSAVKKATPSTPSNQRLRAQMKQQPTSGSSSVLSAALNQQHPSVSVTKIRQLLRADSAQKKREEEKERQERLMLDRKAKEERAQAQKKQLLEERAITAKLKREQRLIHAAEVRKARELQKAKDAKKAQPAKVPPPAPETQETQPDELPVAKLNETFKKPSEINNIDISKHDETIDGHHEKTAPIAGWTKPPYLRDALIKQFSKNEVERLRDVLKVFPSVKLPVELAQIFGSNKAGGTRYLCRTSSAVWSPPNRGIKRTSSMVDTPSKN